VDIKQEALRVKNKTLSLLHLIHIFPSGQGYFEESLTENSFAECHFVPVATILFSDNKLATMRQRVCFSVNVTAASSLMAFKLN